ncbi:MAG TPA: type II toxin-antitoxin system RelE/ParE family toxin [Gammaproteobacteria bacterium]|jgi:phage-related protein|nr:type II toxin-antitoxin system RelE/ParE family toxin [Gammaproteobacteria bacterium]
MEWKIDYFNATVQDGIYSLPETLRAKYIKITNLMISYGPNLGEPNTKYLGNGLCELRLIGKEGIARVFYCTVVKNRIIMLHGFIKKTQKIPKKELALALKRMKEVKYD